MDVLDTLQRYITHEMLKDKRQIDPDESLISSGLLDSLTLLQLIAFIEEEFGIKVDSGEMAPQNFQTLNIMKAYVEKKLGSE